MQDPHHTGLKALGQQSKEPRTFLGSKKLGRPRSLPGSSRGFCRQLQHRVVIPHLQEVI